MITEQLVDQLHKVLVDEIRTRRPEYLRGPFTVAEIYQDLVPYRTHRDRIGASMNGDYEHALLRLLAGEGDYIRIESEPARKRMAEELGSTNPNTGLFREFAALDVRLNPALIPTADEAEPSPPPRPSAAPPSAPASGSPTGAGHAAGASGVGKPETVAAARPEAVPPLESAGEAKAPTHAQKGTGGRGGDPTSSASEPPESCRWCREALPRRANLRFCPFCGTDVNLVPCPSCGDEIEPGWRFCIACGAEVSAA